VVGVWSEFGSGVKLDRVKRKEVMAIAGKVADTVSDNLIPSTVTPEIIDSIVTSAKTTDKDPSTKTWVEFFKMIGMDALTATEAQKKENIHIRTKRWKRGLKRLWRKV
jgi:hypothetical protein